MLRFGRRRFSPSPAFTVLMLVLCIVFIALGRWQWRRGNARSAEDARFERGARQVLALGSTPLAHVPDYQEVSVTGSYDPTHQFLIDNMSYRDLDGYQVLTPLERPGGRVVLVDRGWVPFLGSRSELPDISLKSTGSLTVTGRVGELPTAGLAFGRAPPPASGPWPRVTSFPTLSQLSSALGRPLEPHIILLDPRAPDGYLRVWRLPGIPAMQNFGYAFEWWCFAIAAIAIWLVLSSKRQPAGVADRPGDDAMTKSSGTILDGDSRPNGRGAGTEPRKASPAPLRARNLRTLAGLAALFLAPLVASFWLYYGTGWRPAGHVNHGELISPPRPLPSVNLPRVPLAPLRSAVANGRVSGNEELSPAEPTLFRSTWTLAYIGDGSCDASCRRTLYVMRQTQLALGADMMRVARVFLVTGNCCAKAFLAREHAGLIVLDASGATGEQLVGEFPPQDRAHSLFIVDPLGNLMMRYDVRRDPGGLLIDLRRLLELSEIG